MLFRTSSTFTLMTTGSFSQNVGKVIFRTQVGNRFMQQPTEKPLKIFIRYLCSKIFFTTKKGELQYMFAPSCNHKWLHQTIVTRVRPFGHVPFAAFASNWLTAATWVPNWSAYHSRSTEETTLRNYKNHYEAVSRAQYHHSSFVWYCHLFLYCSHLTSVSTISLVSLD